MPVSEQGLSAAATGRATTAHPAAPSRNPVACLVVERVAQDAAPHAQAVREAGALLLDLLRTDAPAGPRLTVPVAMGVLVRNATRPVGDAHAHLAHVMARDPLLTIGVYGIASRTLTRAADPARSDAVLRALSLLVRMVEAQAEVDDLHAHFALR